jgi:DNA replication and repair protein RecF
MALRRVQVTDFRCLQSVALDLDPRFTLISGANASGKTSLLEALYVLGRGRSFRTRRLEHLIRHGAERFVIFGEVDAHERRVGLGVEGSTEGIRAQLAGAKAQSLAELALLLPVQIIDPEIHRLIEEGPSRRRRFLDWGVFHVEPNFVEDWQRFQRALKQRNAALRSRQGTAVIAAWDADVVRYGESVSGARTRYVEALLPHAVNATRRLLGMDLTLSYRLGWPRELNLSEALQRNLAQDQESGVTQTGPHRADLTVRLEGHAVRDWISRGQQKLLAAALLLAQIQLFPDDLPVQPSLLLDDPAAELDNERLTGLIAEVSSHALQLIVTTLHSDFSGFGAPGLHYRIAAGELRLA